MTIDQAKLEEFTGRLAGDFAATMHVATVVVEDKIDSVRTPSASTDRSPTPRRVLKNKVRTVLLAALVAVLAGASPAGAITYGEPDAGEHPYVGFVIFFRPSAQGWSGCSGTLMDADTFLTAGHCAFGIGIDGAYPEGYEGSGGTDVWATFDGGEDGGVLTGWPSRADIPDVASLYAARRAWLEDPANGFTSGTAIPHENYGVSFPERFDVGVVQLDTDVAMTNYGELAPVGTVESMLAASPNRNSALVETVGYGVQALQPELKAVNARHKSTSRIVENNSYEATGGNLHTSNNPSPQGGQGGFCYGDSGGPMLVNNTDDVIAVNSYVHSPTCHGAGYGWRVDTEAGHQFLDRFL